MNVSKIKYLYNLNVSNLLNKSVRVRKLSSKPKVENVFAGEPIKYSLSPASRYKAKFSRTGIAEPRLWYEPYVLLTSVAVFLIYFTVLREENDIDVELNQSLYSRIAGLEEHQLKLSLEYNQQKGLDTEAIRKRLKEIEDEKKSLGVE